jgi:hypothetical protein
MMKDNDYVAEAIADAHRALDDVLSLLEVVNMRGVGFDVEGMRAEHKEIISRAEALWASGEATLASVVFPCRHYITGLARIRAHAEALFVAAEN